MVPDLVGGRRLDVHRLHSQSVRHFNGQIHRGHTARHLSEHDDDQTGQVTGACRVGAVVHHLSATVGRI